MKKARFTEEQMVAILREADKGSVAEVAKKHKVSEQTIYVWRRRFGQLEPADVRRLRELEMENARLKRMIGEREMAIETLKEINYLAPSLSIVHCVASVTHRRWMRCGGLPPPIPVTGIAGCESSCAAKGMP